MEAARADGRTGTGVGEEGSVKVDGWGGRGARGEEEEVEACAVGCGMSGFGTCLVHEGIERVGRRRGMTVVWMF